MAILRADKINFKTKIAPRDKTGYFIMVRGQIYQEDTTMINLYTSNNRVPKIM